MSPLDGHSPPFPPSVRAGDSLTRMPCELDCDRQDLSQEHFVNVNPLSLPRGLGKWPESGEQVKYVGGPLRKPV